MMAWKLEPERLNDKSRYAFRHHGIDYYWNPAKDRNLQWLQWYDNGIAKVVELYLDTHSERCILETKLNNNCPRFMVYSYGKIA